MTQWSGRSTVIRILASLTALGVVLALVGLLLPRVFSSEADGDASTRKQVIARATDFAVTYNTYDVADVDDYQKRLKGLLTTAYNTQVVEVTDAIFKALKGKKQKSGDAKVLAVAIDAIDQDSAEALVAVDSSITNTDNAAAVLRHFRWRISFSKSKGDWLISNFESVAAVTAESGQPSATPGPSATPDGDKK